MPDSIASNLEKLTSSANRILLLQGPLGGFFYQFAQWLKKQGKTVFKINFNYGDEVFYPATTPDTFGYQGTHQTFDTFLNDFISRHQIDALVCFGDTRPYHLIAKELADNTKNLNFWAFEEGYFRPFYITLEEQGVNDYSPLPRKVDFFKQAYPKLKEQNYHEPPSVPGGFLPMARAAIIYYAAANLFKRKYPNYIHHRHFDIGHYIRSWTLSGFKRANYWFKDHKFAEQVKSGKFGRFYILPLQVFNDSQVRVHSDFSSVRNFLYHVLDSFALHAPKDVTLIVKHHPMDRGFIDYQKDIKKFLKKHPERRNKIFYVRDVPLPVLLRYGIGMITINSTSGLSALIHNMPVKIMGRASYDIPGITDQNKLADFWKNPQKPNAEYFHAYRMYHINVTQINGSFYSRVNLPDHITHTISENHTTCRAPVETAAD
ncbi:capsule biosynthesis protein [Neisseria sp. S1]|uniref:capsule biosynthesis protein n=1 Tax=Neisseria sp. S1 TaxID=3318354 RepID=UPI003A871D66